MKDTNMHGLDYSMVAFFVQKTVLLLSSFRELVFRVSTDSDRQRGKRERYHEKMLLISKLGLRDFFFFNMGVRVSLRIPRLIPQALKLTTI
jgi:hypothetical protein